MDTDVVFRNQSRPPVDVLLINMPFGPLKKPSIGLSLLQAGLCGTPISSKILYFTLLFATRSGIDLYENISTGPYSSMAQVGEWIFSSALFPDQDPNQYLETILFADDPYVWHGEVKRRDELTTLSKNLLILRSQASSF